MFDKDKAINQLCHVTNDPLAGLKLEKAHTAMHQAGRMFATIANPKQVYAIKSKLLSGFTAKELDELAETPEFVVALAACATQALVSIALWAAKEDRA